MKIIIVATVLCLAALPVLAQVQPPTVRMSLDKANSVLGALHSLDSCDKVIKDGESQKVLRAPCSFTGSTRLLIAKDMDALIPSLKQFDAARTGMIAQIDGGTPKIDTPAYAKLAKEIQSLLDTENEYQITKIKPEELNLDTNTIPASVLSSLSPILDRGDGK